METIRHIQDVLRSQVKELAVCADAWAHQPNPWRLASRLGRVKLLLDGLTFPIDEVATWCEDFAAAAGAQNHLGDTRWAVVNACDEAELAGIMLERAVCQLGAENMMISAAPLRTQGSQRSQ